MRVHVVNVSELCDQHVVAEHRSICNILTNLALGKLHYECDRPDVFEHGKGHIKFWTNKLRYLYYRHEALYYEARSRGITLTATARPGAVTTRYWNDYRPTRTDVAMDRQWLRANTPKKARWTEGSVISAA